MMVETTEPEVKPDAIEPADEAGEAKDITSADATSEGAKEVDYRAELGRQREISRQAEDARKKAEQALAEGRIREKRKQEGGDYEVPEEEEKEKPLTASQLQTILTAERQANQKEFHHVRAVEIAGKLAGSEDERELILEIHKSRTFPAHLTLEEQIEESWVLANKKKLVGERNEALRALQGKGGVQTNPAGTHHDSPKAGEPKMSSGDAQVLAQVGFAWNGSARRYEKKLKNGDILVRDPQTKNTFVVKAKP